MNICKARQHFVKRKKIATNLTNHILYQRRFGRASSVHFQPLMVKKSRYKHYNKRITTRDNGNVQSHDREESKLNSTINANNGAPTRTHD